MKYPYIGKFVGHTGHSIVLFAGEGKACYLDGDFETSEKYVFRDDYFECEFTNITREYLANTYGEVKSKDHAEFIVKLAENNNLIANDEYLSEHNYFSFSGDELLFFEGEQYASCEGERFVTIPLPPKEPGAIDSLPEVEPTKIFTREEIGGKELEVAEGGICQAIKSSSAIHELESQGYKFTNLGWVSPNASKKPKSKEWPQVGDEVLTASKQKASVVAIDRNQVWIKYKDTSIGCGYATVTIATLSKPLTPEEELAKELEKMVYDGMDNSYDLNHNCYYLVSGLMKIYDIKKKPE